MNAPGVVACIASPFLTNNTSKIARARFEALPLLHPLQVKYFGGYSRIFRSAEGAISCCC